MRTQIVLFLIALSVTTTVSETLGDPREEITDVKTNKEIQNAGRFSVQEYNRRLQETEQKSLRGGGIGAGRGNSIQPLVFIEVVKAERQVVAGFKYYLTLTAMQNRVTRTYDAEVVERTWDHSNPDQLLKFVPSPN